MPSETSTNTIRIDPRDNVGNFTVSYHRDGGPVSVLCESVHKARALAKTIANANPQSGTKIDDRTLSDRTLDARARQAARQAGYEARRSNWRRGSPENQGGFQIIKPETQMIHAGRDFEMSAREAIDWCTDE